MARKRPLILTIVASIGIVWGLAGLSARLLLKGNLAMLADAGTEVGIPGSFIAISALLISLLWLLSSVGLILGLKWGWWVAGWHYMCGIIRFGQAYFMSTGYRPLPDEPFPASLALRNVMAILIYGSLLMLIYSPRTRAWCRVETVSPARAALLTAVIVLSMMGSASLATYFLFKAAG
jgi:hypothetical protein